MKWSEILVTGVLICSVKIHLGRSLDSLELSIWWVWVSEVVLPT